MTTPELPDGVVLTRLTGRYIGPDGTPLKGTLTFTPPTVLKLADNDTFTASRVVVTLTGGEFDVALLPNDVPGMSPSGWSYQVTERLQGVPIRVFHILLPYAPVSVDLADLAPAAPYTGKFLPAYGPQGAKGDQGDPGEVSLAQLDALADATAPRPQQFFQGSPSTAWVIDHTLPYRPAVQLFDPYGSEIGGRVEYPTPTSVTVLFAHAETGSAILH